MLCAERPSGAGAPDAKETTPEMIEAGVREFWRHDRNENDPVTIVLDVYQAMVEVSPRALCAASERHQ
jgi:hypothetical protein